LFRAEAFAANDRQRFLRRWMGLLVAGFASFALVSWMLVRSTRIIGLGARDSEPIAVVKLELGSLGAWRYCRMRYAATFGAYRKEVPFASLQCAGGFASENVFNARISRDASRSSRRANAN